jgi:hypothetical protein
MQRLLQRLVVARVERLEERVDRRARGRFARRRRLTAGRDRNPNQNQNQNQNQNENQNPEPRTPNPEPRTQRLWRNLIA